MAGDDHAADGGCYEQMPSRVGGGVGAGPLATPAAAPSCPLPPSRSRLNSAGGGAISVGRGRSIPLRFDSIVSNTSSSSCGGSSSDSSSAATPRTSGVVGIFRYNGVVDASGGGGGNAGGGGDGPPYCNIYHPPTPTDQKVAMLSLHERRSSGPSEAEGGDGSENGNANGSGNDCGGKPSICNDPPGGGEPACCQYPQHHDPSVDHHAPNTRLSRASTVGASVTFLKALLGVSLLSHPRILSETGLILGTITHIIIILACAFACYLLLKAREMAAEAMARREQEEAHHVTTLQRAHASGSDVDMFLSNADISHIQSSPSYASDPRPFEVACGAKDRLMTYGDVSRQLMGRGASLVITWTIVVLHVLFASGMASGVIRGISEVLAMDTADWQQGQGQGQGNNRLLAGGDEEEQEYDDLYWAGRWGLAFMLFPVVAVLLQMPTLRDLFVISAAGLTIYLGGCVGCLIYTALETNKDDGRWTDDAPEDLWEWKFGGIPTFVASTLYTIEGINLALPTANNIGSPTFAVPVVCVAVCVYGLLTLGIAWIGYLGGLGGGTGTGHEGGMCRQIFLCMESPLVRAIYQVSMCVALLLTLPVILYPSTEILEIWATEVDEARRKESLRKHEERRLGLRATSPPPSSRSSRNIDCGNIKDCVNNDCVELTVGTVPRTLDEGFNHLSEGVRQSLVGEVSTFDEYDIQDVRSFPSAGDGDSAERRRRWPSVVPPPRQHSSAPDVLYEGGDPYGQQQQQQGVRPIKVHRRLRFTLAVAVCVLGAVEVYVHTAFSFIRGIGLSFAGFILPPILYIIAREETERHIVKLKGRMLVPLACLIGFGFFNIVLVFVSSFTSNDYRTK